MEFDFEPIFELIEAMNREGVDYITFGALALSAHGLVRATADADFFIKPTEDNIERLKRALRSVWEDPAIDEINAAELIGDYPAVAYYPPDSEVHVDFVTRLGEAFSFESVESETGMLAEIPIRVVTAATLYRMKKDTVRTKDRIDADALRSKFGFGDS
jgi:hypothetical protein